MRGFLPVLFALVVLIASGAAAAAITRSDAQGTTLVDGSKIFPIVLAKGPEPGSTTPSGADALDEVVAAGVNFFKVGPATTAWTGADTADALTWNKAAAKRGAYTWINLSTFSRAQPASSQDTLLRQIVDTLKADAPAIGMWKGADEPWWNKIAPSSLQFAYCVATSRGDPKWCAGEASVDSDHLWVTIEAPKGTAFDVAPYSAVTDTHGINDYPVTLASANPDLHEVGRWTQTVASITPNHSVWTTLQICASGSYDSTGKFVLPTARQERYMVYDAILSGARNLAFYGGNNPKCWNAIDSSHGWSWTFWNTVLKGLIQEVNAASPIAAALVNPGSSKALIATDSTTRAVSRRGSDPNDVWVIAARSGVGSQAVTIRGLPSTLTSGTVYTEGRSVPVVGGSFTDTFGRWDVHVYHFTTAPAPTLSSFTPASGSVGSTVTIAGTGFTGATAVSFNGSAAAYAIDSDTLLTATVPTATSGPITVTTPGGTATSAGSFDVTTPPEPPPPAAPAPPPVPAPREPAGPKSPATPVPAEAAVALQTSAVFSVPASAVAGRLFSFGIRVVTDAGAPVKSGRVGCLAHAGRNSLRIVSKGWKGGLAYCTWKLPRSARGRKLSGLVRVESQGLGLSRSFTKRVR